MTLLTPADIVSYGPFYKLTKRSEEHYGLQYETGLIRDPVPFNPSGECSAGGMYFFARHQLIHFSKYFCYPYWIREVTFTENSKIWQEQDKFKTDEFILGERQLFWLPPDLCQMAVNLYYSSLRHVEHQTPEMCLSAVKQDGYALEYIENQTPEICMAAVQQNGHTVDYVKHQTPEICLAAVRQNGNALQYVKKQTPEICMAAVQKSWMALQYVRKHLRTPELCFAAVQQSNYALEWTRVNQPELYTVYVQGIWGGGGVSGERRRVKKRVRVKRTSRNHFSE